MTNHWWELRIAELEAEVARIRELLEVREEFLDQFARFQAEPGRRVGPGPRGSGILWASPRTLEAMAELGIELDPAAGE